MKAFHIFRIFAKRNTSLTVMNAFISERLTKKIRAHLRFHASKYNLILPKDVPGGFAQFSRISFLSQRPVVVRIRQLATEIARPLFSNSLKPTHYSSMRDASKPILFSHDQRTARKAMNST